MTENPTDTKPENNRNNDDGHRVPWWVYCLIIICAIPGLAYPFMGDLIASPDMTIRGLTWFYPAYILVSALLAWQCYGRRTLLSWIILVLMLLSHVCFYYLAFVASSITSYR